VEGTLFKVPRRYFEHKSELFNTIFKLPTNEEVVEGLSDDKPFVLAGIKKVDFENLLKVIYPL
jgi:hypothetical protein